MESDTEDEVLKKHKCDFCDKTYNLPGNLYVHMKQVHNPFKNDKLKVTEIPEKYAKKCMKNARSFRGGRPCKATVEIQELNEKDQFVFVDPVGQKNSNYNCTYCHERFTINRDLRRYCLKI